MTLPHRDYYAMRRGLTDFEFNFARRIGKTTVGIVKRGSQRVPRVL